MVVGLLLTACAGNDDPARRPTSSIDPDRSTATLLPAGQASATCSSAMAAAAQADLSGADAAIARTTEACTDANDWFAALRQHPGAFGLAPGAEITVLEIQLACFDDGANPASPVCTDARSQGYLDP